MGARPTRAESTEADARTVLQFGCLAFDTSANRLSRDGVEVHLTPKAAAVLSHLLQRPDEIISKDEFLEAVWEGVHVREESLTQAISVIRHALGDSATSPEFIETVSGEGYRFVGNVSTVVDSAGSKKRGDSVRTDGRGNEALVAQDGQRAIGDARTDDKGAPALRREALAVAAIVVAAIGILAWFWPPAGKPEEADASSASNPGPGIRPLTSFPGYEEHPELSPDGRKVAFTMDAGDGPQLYVQLLSGEEPRPFAAARPGDPAWDPDSERIAYMRDPERSDDDVGPRGLEIRTITFLGTEDHPLFTTSITQSGLDWSPDGRFLAFSDRPGPGERPTIFLLEVETGTTHQVTVQEGTEATEDVSPSFSPDGRYLAFIRLRAAAGTVGYIHVQQLDEQGQPAGESERLASPVGFLHDLDWTADGSAIVYSGGGRPTTTRT